jgi:hypothetical protein
VRPLMHEGVRLGYFILNMGCPLSRISERLRRIFSLLVKQ